MKKIKFLGAAVLAASLIFAGCSSPAGAAPEINNPIDNNENNNETGQENNNNNNNNENGQNENNNNQNNNNEQNENSNQNNENNGENSGSETHNYTAPAITDYYKNYLVSSPAVASNKTIADWGAGSTAAPNADGTWTISASDSMWTGVGGICAPFTGLEAGSLSNYEYIVFTIDTTNYVINNTDDGAGNCGVNIKVPDVQKDISNNYVETGKVRTYYAPMSLFESAPETANEFAIIIGGSGSLKLNEVYFAAAQDPANKPVSSISITPASANIEAGSTSNFIVKDSNFVDVTSSASFEITGTAAEGCSIDAGVFTAGTTAGDVTITATYTVDGKVFSAAANVVIVVKATTAKELLDPTSEGFKLDNVLPFVNTVDWGGTNTSPTAEQVNGIDAIVCTVPEEGIGGWGISAAWQGPAGEKISLIGYDSISITVKDEFGEGKAFTSAILKIKAATEIEKNVNVSEPDADGWRTITISLSEYSDIDLGSVVCIHLANWSDAPAAGGKLYISKVTLNPAAAE